MEVPALQQMLQVAYEFVNASKVLEWLRWAGLHFDPFEPLDAAADTRLNEYLVGHHIFARVWGNVISWVFAPAGGGKTALRISITQACWLGQETNRPFPIPYVPPFLSWGHSCPSLEDHLAAITRAGAISLFLALAHRPHWFFRLDREGRRRVYEALSWNLPAALSVYLERCRQARDVSALRKALDPTFVIPNPPGADELLRWCDELDKAPDVVSPPSPLERWKRMQELLLEVLGFPAVYILADGFDGAPETMANAEAVARCLAPLVPSMGEWANRKIFFKSFLPLETEPVFEKRFPEVVIPERISTIQWTPALLAEVIRRRVYVASEGAFSSLDAVASPALRDIETTLAKAVFPIPREILVLTRRVLEEHVRREGSIGLLQEEDVEAAIYWYQAESKAKDFFACIGEPGRGTGEPRRFCSGRRVL